MKNRKKIYTKLLAIVTILATLPVIIVGLFSYLKSAEIIELNVAEEKQQSIYQIQTNFEQVLQTVDLSVTTFVTSHQLIKTLKEPLTTYQFQLYHQIKKEINQLQRSDSGVSNFLLVSLEQGWRINNNGLRRLKEGQADEIIQRYASLPYKSSWIIEKEDQVLFDSSDGNSCNHYINLVKKLPLNSNQKTGIAIAYVPICDFTAMLASHLESESLMVLDENYTVIAHSDSEQIGANFSSQSFISKLSEQQKNNGQYDIALNGSNYKVTYRKSAYNNWTYISVIKISELNKQSHSIGWFTLLISIVILLGAVIFSLIASYRLYAPINRITTTLSNSLSSINQSGKKVDEFSMIESQIEHVLEQNDELESRLQGQIVQLKQFFMARLLQGNINSEELPNKLHSFGYAQDWKRFSVLALQIDSVEDTEYNIDNEEILLFTVNTMIEELIPSNKRMTPIVINKTQVTLFFDDEAEDKHYAESLTTMIKNIKLEVLNDLGLSISVGISKTYKELADAHEAFKESREALRHVLKFGPGSIIFYENLQSDSSFFTFYPKHIENDLFNAIKVGDKLEVDQNLEKLLESLFNEELSNTQHEIAIVRLLTNLIKLTETLGVNVLKYDGHKSLFNQLYEFRTLPEVVNWFKKLIIYPIMDESEERTQSQYKNISDEIIHIVQQEFDSDLTLNYIADKLHYNANYLSSIFRKETNTSFSDYLALYRINVAKKWLAETDSTVKDIAERLNYKNSQNFIRSFKKVEGITPGKYRQDKQG
ncbi:helix-turn-helix domain-containing protein [Sporosarcina beigongshangi]|uniref:helix-turn-helix domain-containing protein n=1 Tax=Sporosarcina beigongshangi TaxID=2782538 RepID=UPI001939BDD9|nr:helix-turn-helix domain-containing protein [Sporosarcina beigongshangi]